MTKIVNDAPDMIRLRLPLERFDALHVTLDKVRSTSATVKVEVADLRALLADHSVCLAGRLVWR
jgi:hypothetical protein